MSQIKVVMITKEQAAPIVKKAIVRVLPSAAMLVTDKQVQDVMSVLYADGYKLIQEVPGAVK